MMCSMSITVLQVEADPLVSCNNNYSLQAFHIIAKECCPTGSDKSNHVQVPIGEIGIGIICGYVSHYLLPYLVSKS